MLNKVILIGNLGNDPDVRYSAQGEMVVNISIATSETFKDKEGNKKTNTEWHRVVFFGKTAEIIAKWLKKGSSIYIEGKIKTRKWQDQQGNDKYSTEIIGDTMKMLGGKGGTTGAEEYQPHDEADKNGDKKHNDNDSNNSASSSSDNNHQYSREPVKQQTADANINNSAAFNDDDIPF